MCRLLGYATRTPASLAELLGERDLADFTELSCKHGDGWGVARVAEGGDLDVRKAPESARLSAEFSRTASEDATDLGMVHLRWATLGLPVVESNAHPFTDGRVAFAHNGSIAPPASLEPLLDDRARSLLRGDTDSERLFLAILSRLPDGAVTADDLGRAVAQTARAVTRDLTYSSLNSMLLTPTHLFALCVFDPAAEAREAEPDYYRLRHRSSEDGFVVTSSGWGSGWDELDNGQLLVVERSTLHVSVHDLDLELARA